MKPPTSGYRGHWIFSYAMTPLKNCGWAVDVPNSWGQMHFVDGQIKCWYTNIPSIGWWEIYRKPPICASLKALVSWWFSLSPMHHEESETLFQSLDDTAAPATNHRWGEPFGGLAIARLVDQYWWVWTCSWKLYWLVVWNMFFFHILGRLRPTD